MFYSTELEWADSLPTPSYRSFLNGMGLAGEVKHSVKYDEDLERLRLSCEKSLGGKQVLYNVYFRGLPKKLVYVISKHL